MGILHQVQPLSTKHIILRSHPKAPQSRALGIHGAQDFGYDCQFWELRH